MDISYKIVRSRRKTVAIHITSAGEVELRCPLKFPTRECGPIIESRRGWIEKQLAKIPPKMPTFTPSELADMKKAVLPVLEERVRYFAPLVGVDFGKITVRSQKSRWGSCSRDGNLSFNCLLSQVPEEVIDYVVVHELCHRKQMNHSAAFWQEVERMMPDYRVRRGWLSKNGNSLIGRIGR